MCVYTCGSWCLFKCMCPFVCLVRLNQKIQRLKLSGCVFHGRIRRAKVQRLLMWQTQENTHWGNELLSSTLLSSLTDKKRSNWFDKMFLSPVLKKSNSDKCLAKISAATVSCKWPYPLCEWPEPWWDDFFSLLRCHWLQCERHSWFWDRFISRKVQQRHKSLTGGTQPCWQSDKSSHVCNQCGKKLYFNWKIWDNLMSWTNSQTFKLLVCLNTFWQIKIKTVAQYIKNKYISKHLCTQ